jgi:hypothetical protein
MTAPTIVQGTFTERLADQIQEVADPKYVEFKATGQRIGKAKILMGAIILATAVALLILGIALCSAGYLGALAAIFISLPLFYIGYNTSALGNNINTIAENPRRLTDWGGFGNFDKEKFKEALKKGTFGIDCCIDSAIENITTRTGN